MTNDHLGHHHREIDQLDMRLPLVLLLLEGPGQGFMTPTPLLKL